MYCFQILEREVLEQFRINNIVEICIEILVDFCNEKDFITTLGKKYFLV